MSLFFINVLQEPAIQYFLSNFSSRLEYTQIVDIMRPHYNSETRELQLQSEIEGLELNSFMRKHNMMCEFKRLAILIDRTNALAPQLPHGFGDDHYKIRYLRHAALGCKWAWQPISQMTIARYTFTQFIISLQESLQL